MCKGFKTIRRENEFKVKDKDKMTLDMKVSRFIKNSLRSKISLRLLKVQARDLTVTTLMEPEKV